MRNLSGETVSVEDGGLARCPHCLIWGRWRRKVLVNRKGHWYRVSEADETKAHSCLGEARVSGSDQ